MTYVLINNKKNIMCTLNFFFKKKVSMSFLEELAASYPTVKSSHQPLCWLVGKKICTYVAGYISVVRKAFLE